MSFDELAHYALRNQNQPDWIRYAQFLRRMVHRVQCVTLGAELIALAYFLYFLSENEKQRNVSAKVKQFWILPKCDSIPKGSVNAL